MEDSTRDIVRKAAAAVGSLKETEFDIRFNPDVYSPGVRHSDPDVSLACCELLLPFEKYANSHVLSLLKGKRLHKERQLVKDAAEFLVTTQIPGFVSFTFAFFFLKHW